MQAKEKYYDRRRNKRRNLSFEIAIPDQVGKTINVSASGVYFEVITNDMNVYSPGTTIPLKITAVNATPVLTEKEQLSGIAQLKTQIVMTACA